VADALLNYQQARQAPKREKMTGMNRLLKTLQVASIATLTLVGLASTAGASPVLDFGTGWAGEGGMITLFSDGSVSGVGIPIGKLTVLGAPSGNGVYAVDGTATDAFNDTYGSLSFDTGGLAGANFIKIDGYLPSKPGFGGIGSASSIMTLMSGTLSNFSLNSDLSGNPNGIGGAVGWALASPLATLLGLSTDLQYTFVGWSISTDPLSAESPSGAAISTDVKLTAVPEPGSIMLLGSGLLFAAGSMKRRFNL
jgi:hypothetical protein